MLRRIARERPTQAAEAGGVDTPDWLMRRWSRTYGGRVVRAIEDEQILVSRPHVPIWKSALLASHVIQLGHLVLRSGDREEGNRDRLEGGAYDSQISIRPVLSPIESTRAPILSSIVSSRLDIGVCGATFR